MKTVARECTRPGTSRPPELCEPAANISAAQKREAGLVCGRIPTRFSPLTRKVETCRFGVHPFKQRCSEVEQIVNVFGGNRPRVGTIIAILFYGVRKVSQIFRQHFVVEKPGKAKSKIAPGSVVGCRSGLRAIWRRELVAGCHVQTEAKHGGSRIEAGHCPACCTFDEHSGDCGRQMLGRRDGCHISDRQVTIHIHEGVH